MKHKYRAWDKKNNCMIYDDIAVGDGVVLVLTLGYEHNEWIEQEGLISMLLVGLEDKNGKEIYKDDIVAIPNGWNYSSCLEENVKQEKNRYQYSLGVVWFNKGIFELNSEIEAIDKNYLHYFYEKSCIVIGNKYENKELLK